MAPVSDSAVFVQVVTSGSFTAAAEAMGLSKGAVSKYVARLEEHLGARLLNRTTRKLTLTEAGERYFERAHVALAELVAAEAEIAELSDAPRGRLRVSAPTFYGVEILSKLIGPFLKRYPEVDLDVVLDNRFVDLVAERFDVAIRFQAPRDSSLVMRKLTEIPIVACAAPSYIEARGQPKTPVDLREHDCLLYSVAARPNDWLFRSAGGRPLAVPVKGRLTSNDDHALRQAAVDGLGVLFMPKLFIEDALASGALTQLFPDEAGRSVTLGLVYPSRAALPAKTRAFVDYMAGTCAGQAA